MKLKISVVILFVFCFYLGVNAQSRLIENFNYTAGDTIGSYGWVTFSGGPNNPITVVSPGLTYTGYPLSGIGNSARIRSTGEDYYKAFSGDSVTSGSVYAAFMVSVDTGKTGDYFVALLPSSSTTLYTARTWIKDSSSMVSFGVSKSTATSSTLGYTGPAYSYRTTYLLIVKYKFNTGSTTDDEISLYVFTAPTLPTTEPSTPTLGPYTGTQTDATSIGRFAIRQGSASSSPTLWIDGINVATTWTALVTGVKTISTVANNFSLSQNYPNPFNPVTNINFSIPANGSAKLSVYNALGQEVQSLLNGSINAGTYSVKFDGRNLNSGLYFYKLELNSVDGKYFSDVKKLMLVK